MTPISKLLWSDMGRCLALTSGLSLPAHAHMCTHTFTPYLLAPPTCRWKQRQNQSQLILCFNPCLLQCHRASECVCPCRARPLFSCKSIDLWALNRSCSNFSKFPALSPGPLPGPLLPVPQSVGVCPLLSALTHILSIDIKKG